MRDTHKWETVAKKNSFFFYNRTYILRVCPDPHFGQLHASLDQALPGMCRYDNIETDQYWPILLTLPVVSIRHFLSFEDVFQDTQFVEARTTGLHIL